MQKVEVSILGLVLNLDWSIKVAEIIVFFLGWVAKDWLSKAKERRNSKERNYFLVQNFKFSLDRNYEELSKTIESIKEIQNDITKKFYTPFLDTYNYSNELINILNFDNTQWENVYKTRNYCENILKHINIIDDIGKSIIKETILEDNKTKGEVQVHKFLLLTNESQKMISDLAVKTQKYIKIIQESLITIRKKY